MTWSKLHRQKEINSEPQLKKLWKKKTQLPYLENHPAKNFWVQSNSIPDTQLFVDMGGHSGAKMEKVSTLYDINLATFCLTGFLTASMNWAMTFQLSCSWCAFFICNCIYAIDICNYIYAIDICNYIFTIYYTATCWMVIKLFDRIGPQGLLGKKAGVIVTCYLFTRMDCLEN